MNMKLKILSLKIQKYFEHEVENPKSQNSKTLMLKLKIRIQNLFEVK